MRPTGLGHGAYKDNVDYGVFCGDWCIGRIYETRTGPADLRWFWALYAPSKPGNMRTSNRVATLDLAKAEFEASSGSSGSSGPGWKRCRSERGQGNVRGEARLGATQARPRGRHSGRRQRRPCKAPRSWISAGQPSLSGHCYGSRGHATLYPRALAL